MDARPGSSRELRARHRHRASIHQSRRGEMIGVLHLSETDLMCKMKKMSNVRFHCQVIAKSLPSICMNLLHTGLCCWRVVRGAAPLVAIHQF